MSYQILGKCNRCGSPTYLLDGWASAAPQPAHYICKCYTVPPPPVPSSPSMYLRQWYAGMALQGLVANPDVKAMFKAGSVTEERAAAIDKSYAQIALRLADALLAEEEK